jgi:hypothetical protein
MQQKKLDYSATSSASMTDTHQEAIEILGRLKPEWIETMPLAASKPTKGTVACERWDEYFPDSREGIVVWYLGAGYAVEETGFRVVHVVGVDELQFIFNAANIVLAVEA